MNFLHFSAFTVFLCIKTTRLVCNLLHFSLKITMKWNFLHFSAFTVFLCIKSTRLVCKLLNFSLKITMKWNFLHFSTFTVFLCIKSTRLVCNLLHFSLKITMNDHFLHFSTFTVFLCIKSTRLVCNLLHLVSKMAFSLKSTTVLLQSSYTSSALTRLQGHWKNFVMISSGLFQWIVPFIVTNHCITIRPCVLRTSSVFIVKIKILWYENIYMCNCN